MKKKKITGWTMLGMIITFLGVVSYIAKTFKNIPTDITADDSTSEAEVTNALT